MSKAHEIAAAYFPTLDQRSRSTMECLIDLVFDVLPAAQHESKWGQLTFTLDGDWHHWICALSPTKTAVRLVIHKGALLSDPRGVMEGKGRYLRAIRFRSPEEIDAGIVTPILREAAARQFEMRL